MPEAGGGSRGRPSASGSLTCNALSRHTDLTRAVNTPEAERTNKRRAYLKAKPPCRDRGRGARGLITASEATHWPGRPPPAPRAPGLARWGAGAGAPAAAAARGQAARLAGARAAGRGRRCGAGGPRLGSHFSASPAAALPRPPPAGRGRRESPAEFAQGASRVRGVRRGERAGGVPFRRPFGIRNGDRHQQEAGARCGGRRPGRCSWSPRTDGAGKPPWAPPRAVRAERAHDHWEK